MSTIQVQAKDLVAAIGDLSTTVEYRYPDAKNKARIRIISVEKPEGPVRFIRYDPTKGQTPGQKRTETIGASMLQRVALAIAEDKPFQVDRILGASYNTRATLEALLAHTPQFVICYPGRVQSAGSTKSVKRGHKHLVWTPSTPHVAGVMEVRDTTVVISEQTIEVMYEALSLPQGIVSEGLGAEVTRRHAQIQILLILVGEKLGMRTYVAKNDQGVLYGGQPLATRVTVVTDLSKEPMLASYPLAADKGALIDAIWFKDAKAMPAIFEVEHTTGVTSGLSRMMSFKSQMPDFKTRYVIVAPDEDRSLVLQKIRDEQFGELEAAYMPYSAVEELFSLVSRRRVLGVRDDFLDTYLERP